MFDKYLEEKMIIRIQIWRDVFIKHLNEQYQLDKKTFAADIADIAIDRFDQICKGKTE